MSFSAKSRASFWSDNCSSVKVKSTMPDSPLHKNMSRLVKSFGVNGENVKEAEFHDGSSFRPAGSGGKAWERPFFRFIP
jgi:hypothetical protein